MDSWWSAVGLTSTKIVDSWMEEVRKALLVGRLPCKQLFQMSGCHKKKKKKKICQTQTLLLRAGLTWSWRTWTPGPASSSTMQDHPSPTFLFILKWDIYWWVLTVMCQCQQEFIVFLQERLLDVKPSWRKSFKSMFIIYCREHFISFDSNFPSYV